ncbi:hypothetical protein C8R43DRAFT_1012714 [Mycena crocata]|nr:hypothetical protein C8R43DRAFT_1012714 [Mycena crocata]
MTDATTKDKGKARQVPVDASPQNPTLIRITNHGKITTWVTFALDFLEKHPEIPIVLHTLPAPPRPRTIPPEGALPEAGPSVHASSTAAPNAPKAPPTSALPNALHTSSTVPRLISVVEIIKREYVKTLDLAQVPAPTGLHQYNEVGTLEALDAGTREELGLSARDDLGLQGADADALRSRQIIAALEGKSAPKTKQTPFMKITLSRTELPGLATTATYQPPPPIKLSKSARTRAKRREKKEGEAAAAATAEGEVGMDVS